MSFVRKFILGNEVNNNLYKAIFSGDLDKVSEIIDSFGLAYSTFWDEGRELLLTAIECKHFDMAKLLLNKGCKVESTQTSTEKDNKSVLHLTVRQGGDIELINMLIDRDKHSLMEIEQGDAVLHLAITEGQEELVKTLLERGSDIECRTKGGMTSIHLAAIRGQVNILELLLTSGADIESVDYNGKTGLFLAVSCGERTVVNSLLKHGANSRCKSNNGLTPLLDATCKCYSYIVQNLLDFGADSNDRNSFGQTPLHIACMQKKKDIVAALLNAGADVNATDSMGMVPCDAIIKRVSPNSYFFDNSSVSYVMGKHLSLLKIGGFHLNKKNENFYDMFYYMYCKEITVGNVVLAYTSNALHSTIKGCQEEIVVMKTTKSENGYTAYHVFKKLQDPLGVTTEIEMKFLESLYLRREHNMYGMVIKNLVKNARQRNELLEDGQGWLSLIVQQSQNKIPELPEEMRLNILSYLSNNEVKCLIKCGEQMYRPTKPKGS